MLSSSLELALRELHCCILLSLLPLNPHMRRWTEVNIVLAPFYVLSHWFNLEPDAPSERRHRCSSGLAAFLGACF